MTPEAASSHEYYDHTADVGVLVEADDLESMFEEAARALFGFFVRDLHSVQPVREIGIRLEAGAPEDLLVDWLQELLVVFEVRGLLLSRFDVRVTAAGTAAETAAGKVKLEARAWGEDLDPERHVLGPEVKAVTYHRLRVERNAGRCRAEFVLDI